MFFGRKIGRSNFCHILIIYIAILRHVVLEWLRFDFKFGLGILEKGYMQILVNLAILFLSKMFFGHPVYLSQ